MKIENNIGNDFCKIVRYFQVTFILKDLLSYHCKDGLFNPLTIISFAEMKERRGDKLIYRYMGAGGDREKLFSRAGIGNIYRYLSKVHTYISIVLALHTYYSKMLAFSVNLLGSKC